jgi:hypothetical protein
MERKTFRLGRWSQRVLPFFAALGLTMVGGCGSDGDNHKDANPGVSDGPRPDANTPDGQIKTDTPPATDVEPAGDVSPQLDVVSVDGPVGLEAPRGPDLAIEKPIAQDDAEPDVPIGGEVNPGYDAQGTGGAAGGAGGSTGVGTGGSTSGGGIGGSTEIGGTGGVPATGGTGGTGTGSLIIGWPTDSAQAPHVFAATCNGAAQAAPAGYTFTLKNTGSTTTTFTGVSFSGATGYTVDLTAGTSQIGPGESKVVTITPPAIPFTISPPATIASVLTLTTDEPTDNLHTIFLSEEIHGAKLAWGTGAISGYLGGSAPGGTLTREFTVTNSGDQAATADIASSYPNFTIATSTAVTIPAKGSVTRTLTFTAPNQEGTYTAAISLVPSQSNNLCAPVPNAWTLQALSLGGYPQLTPSTGDFAFSGFCGETPTRPNDDPITIKNVGTDTLKWLPVLDQDAQACFNLVHPSIPQGTTWLELGTDSTETIKVSPKAVAAAGTECGGKLTVKFVTTQGEKSNLYNLKVIPLGASITATPTKLDFQTTNITTPATTVQPIALTLQNVGLIDTVNQANTSVTITLTIDQTSGHSPHDSNPPFIFAAQGDDPAGLVTHITLDASNKGVIQNQKTVLVKYQRPEFGPYSADPDNYHVTWTTGNKTCGSASGKAADLVGEVTEAKVTFGFTDNGTGYFGDAYCGAAASSRTFFIKNELGDGPLTITKAEFDTDYFKFQTPPTLPLVVNASSGVTFQVVPKTVDPATISPSDLASGSTKFDTNLLIETDSPSVNEAGMNVGAHKHKLTMQARGIYISSVNPAPNWNFQAVTWPANTVGSALTAGVVNVGNVTAKAALVDTAEPKFTVVVGQDTVTPNGQEQLISGKFGPFDSCDVVTTTYSASGNLQFTAEGQSGTTGVCHGGLIPLSLSGQVTQTGSMCSYGQKCVKQVDHAPHAPAAQCMCTTESDSCGNLGCCESSLPNAACILFANQSSKLGGAYKGCGKGGSQCQACTLGAAVCEAGECQCGSGMTVCSGSCTSLTGDPDNCGSCGQACSHSHIVTPTCTNSICGGTCQPGYGDCNYDKLSDGCESILATDNNNCGSCGVKCGTGTTCVNGDCSPS